MDDPEATRLMLETLFLIKADVGEIHDAIIGGGEDEEEAEDDS